MARAPRTRAPRPTPPARGGARAAVPYIREQLAAERYTAKWWRVLAWAEQATTLPGFEPVTLSERGLNGRVTRRAVARVRDLRDAEEAFERGLALEHLENLPGGPRRELGGYRRVLVTAYTWKADDSGEVGYDPAWITLGWGMTAHEAGAAVHRFVKSYTERLRDRFSYRLLLTALEVKFWTASSSADYL